MSEAEILELIAIYTTNALTSLTVYVSFTFGYLTVAYFVGSKLSRFQVIATSSIYIVSAFGMMFSTVGIGAIFFIGLWLTKENLFRHSFNAREVANRAVGTSQLPQDSMILSSLIWNGALWIVCIPIGLTLGILVSLYFMYDCRKAGSDGGT